MAIGTRWAALPAGLLLALCVVAFAPTPAQAAAHEVVIKGYAYGPHSLTINEGDTVTWTNLDTAPHDVVVTSGPSKLRSPMLSKGQSWSHTFNEAGAYSYICSVHPDMHGSVTAKAKPAPAPTQAEPTPKSVATPTAQPTRAAMKPNKRPHARAQAAPAQARATPAAAVQEASLDPLVMVLGASTAVVVFCLLLMASRPPARSTEKP